MQVRHGGRALLTGLAQLLGQAVHPGLQGSDLLLQLSLPVPLALVFAVPRQDLLLAADQLRSAHRFVRRLRVFEHFLRKGLLLPGDLADGGAPVKDRFDLPVQSGQTVPHADDLQKRVSLLLIAGRHEAGQVQRQLLHELVEQLLTSLVARGVGNSEGAVLALPFDHEAVRQGDVQPGRRVRALPLRGGRAVLLPAQGPGNGVQHAGLAWPLFRRSRSGRWRLARSVPL